jgi:hypothetical protein
MSMEKQIENETVSTTDIYSNIVLSVILCLLTFGIYYLIWNANQMYKLNLMLGRQEFHFWLWFFMTLLTLGLFHIYYQYKMSSAIVELQRAKGKSVSENLPLISVILTVFGISSIVTDAIQQYEINKIAA